MTKYTKAVQLLPQGRTQYPIVPILMSDSILSAHISTIFTMFLPVPRRPLLDVQREPDGEQLPAGGTQDHGVRNRPEREEDRRRLYLAVQQPHIYRTFSRSLSVLYATLFFIILCVLYAILFFINYLWDRLLFTGTSLFTTFAHAWPYRTGALLLLC